MKTIKISHINHNLFFKTKNEEYVTIGLNSNNIDYRQLKKEFDILKEKNILDLDTLIFLFTILNPDAEQWETGIWGDNFQYISDSLKTLNKEKMTNKEFPETIKILCSFENFYFKLQEKNTFRGYYGYNIGALPKRYRERLSIDALGKAVVKGDLVYFQNKEGFIVKSIIINNNYYGGLLLTNGERICSYRIYSKLEDLIEKAESSLICKIESSVRDLKTSTEALENLRKKYPEVKPINVE